MVPLTGDLILIALLCVVLWAQQGAAAQPSPARWKAGAARTEITPSEPMWMAGYASRDHPAEGTMHPLWVKVLALEDAQGRRAVLVTSDLLGWPKGISDQIRKRLQETYRLGRDQVMLTSSHTHSGPVLERGLRDVYPLDAASWRQIAHYSGVLADRTVEAVGAALERLEPAHLFSGKGVTRFAVNRRNNEASTLEQATELAGPIDHAVPVLKVESAAGHLQAVAFGYACHATVLSGYEWSGDYPGFAQIELEEAFPGAIALFFAGAGADQNPLPRRSVALARQYGRTLAAAAGRVLEEPMQPLEPRLQTSYAEIDLALTDPPSRAELGEMAETLSGWQQRWAARLQDQLERGEALPASYPYPVQVWRLGDQTVVALGGEVVVDYAVELKRLLGQDLFVAAYANDVMAYIPSARVLREGGYEGATSQRVYGLPSTWAADVEVRILAEVLRQAAELGVTPPAARLE